MTNPTRGRLSMRPFQGRGCLAPFSGGVAPGYYMVPLRGRTWGSVRVSVWPRFLGLFPPAATISCPCGAELRWVQTLRVLRCPRIPEGDS